MDQVKIGKYIAKKRKDKGLTQANIAELLSVSDRAVSRWENGINLPDRELIPQLCEELGIRIDEFFAGEDIAMEHINSQSNDKVHPLWWICLSVLVALAVFIIIAGNDDKLLARLERITIDTNRQKVINILGLTDNNSSQLTYLKYDQGSKSVYIYFNGLNNDADVRAVIIRNKGLGSDEVVMPFLEGVYEFKEDSKVTLEFINDHYEFGGDYKSLEIDDRYKSGDCSFEIKEIVKEEKYVLYKMRLRNGDDALLIGCRTDKRVILYVGGKEYQFNR